MSPPPSPKAPWAVTNSGPHRQPWFNSLVDKTRQKDKNVGGIKPVEGRRDWESREGSGRELEARQEKPECTVYVHELVEEIRLTKSKICN